MSGHRAIAGGFVAGAVVLAGCGGSHARVRLGEGVFDVSCKSCHSVIGNESLRRVGGDLVGLRLTRPEIVEFVREMPVRRALRAAQIAAVSDYLLGLERRRPRA